MHVQVWIEEAEDGFVDSEENLEEGEVCIRAVKAFASNPDEEREGGKRFLCAGALVQRPKVEGHVALYDAWMADSVMDNGGPNLQKLGALKIIDELFLYHLEHNQDDGISALKSFMVQCSGEDDFTCASYHAILDRGFAPICELLQQEKTIYNLDDYPGEFSDLEGNLFNCTVGIPRYEQLASATSMNSDSMVASKIIKRLPNEGSFDCAL